MIAPDWRGFGLTAWARDGYWFPDYYADLDALLDLYQPGAPVNLVGHSMGGNIAVHLRGPAPGAHRAARDARRARAAAHRARTPRRSGSCRWMDALRDPPRFRPYASFDEVAQRLKRNNPRLDRRARRSFSRGTGRRRPRAAACELRSDPRHKARNPYLFRIDEALACWRRITAPVLLVTGKDSHIVAWLKDDPGAARGAQGGVSRTCARSSSRTAGT